MLLSSSCSFQIANIRLHLIFSCFFHFSFHLFFIFSRILILYVSYQSVIILKECYLNTHFEILRGHQRQCGEKRQQEIIVFLLLFYSREIKREKNLGVHLCSVFYVKKNHYTFTKILEWGTFFFLIYIT